MIPHMSNSSCSAQATLSTALLMLLSCPGSLSSLFCLEAPVQADLSGRSVQTDLFGLSCPIVKAIAKCKMSCSNLTVMTVLPAGLSGLSCLSQLPCTSVMFWPSCSLFPVLSIPSRLFCPGFPANAVWLQHTCPQLSSPHCLCCYVLICPVLSVLFHTPCPRCPVLEIPCRLSFLLSWLSRLS